MNSIATSLGALADPCVCHEPVQIPAERSGLAEKFLKSMLRIRLVEQRLADARRDGLIGGPVHLGVGQEAVAVGVSSALRRSDRVFGAHRSHSHLLALGSDEMRLFAEILGRDVGHSRGMGGSMHLWDKPNGFYGSVPIVAGTVPLAVGAGLAAKLQETGDVAVAYLGDGAMEEGVVHESLNLARVHNIPVIFVVENNLFASHMHISARQPADATARFADANMIASRIVDGNDVYAIEGAASGAVARARAGQGPSFIEAVTYRWYGHVDWRDDIDVGVNRSQIDVANWRARDPIARLRDAMIKGGMWSERQHAEAIGEINASVEEAWNQAIDAEFPKPEALLDRVFGDNPRQ